uniref:Dehydrogenase n=1 Tax=Piromyces sp. TaxID=45796 RepID=A0A2S1TZ30_PIRSP|nr:Dehydrogenase [Piromyces sp.]
MNPVLETLFKHQCIRKYKNQPVEQEKLELIIKASQSGPNWCNGQHVSIIAVRDPERKKVFAKLCSNQEFISTCGVFLVFCADFYRTGLAFEMHENKGFIEKFASQVDALLVGGHEVGIFMENAIVAAESMGLGTVPIGSIRLHSLEVCKELDLPKYVIPICGLCIGYPDENPGVKPKLPSKAIFFDEKYDTTSLKEKIAEYDVEYQNYLATRGSNERNSTWSKTVSSFYPIIYGKYDEDYELFKKQGYISIDKK